MVGVSGVGFSSDSFSESAFIGGGFGVNRLWGEVVAKARSCKKMFWVTYRLLEPPRGPEDASSLFLGREASLSESEALWAPKRDRTGQRG